jgi:uncharacterized protein YicC (UPF0701 family)
MATEKELTRASLRSSVGKNATQNVISGLVYEAMDTVLTQLKVAKNPGYTYEHGESLIKGIVLKAIEDLEDALVVGKNEKWGKKLHSEFNTMINTAKTIIRNINKWKPQKSKERQQKLTETINDIQGQFLVLASKFQKFEYPLANTLAARVKQL